MKIVRIFSLIAVLIAPLPVSATIINVPADYATIQQGIDASTDGDTVLVQPGTYEERIFFNGHSVVLGSLFLMTGDPSYISSTVIDGQLGGVVISLLEGPYTDVVIAGFTIRNGRGGIYCEYSDIIIRDSKFRDNTTHGAIKCNHSNVLIAGNSLLDNSADDGGGGIDCGNSNATIFNNIISYNVALGTFGGGILCSNYSLVEISSNVVTHNQAGTEGGGIWFARSGGRISNNIVRGNFVTNNNGRGGGIVCKLNSGPAIENNVIFENSVFSTSGSGYGGGLWCYVSSPPVTNNIFWGNTADHGDQIYLQSSVSFISYCDIEGSWSGEGNIHSDPLFRDPDEGDFHLMSVACGNLYDSPCIDIGHPDIADTLLECQWGLGTHLSDIGAFGGGESNVDYGCDYIAGDVNHNGVALELTDLFAMIDAYRGSYSSNYVCICGDLGAFYPAADPNGNCEPFELNDVILELAAYRGFAAVSGCPECPGSQR